MKGVRIITKAEILSKVKSRISARMTTDMLAKIAEGLEKGDYSSRKRSRWISEAIERLDVEFAKESKEDRDYFIRMAEPVTETGVATPISLSGQSGAILAKWVEYCEVQNLDDDDAQTRLVHLAISLRLMRDGIKLI